MRDMILQASFNYSPVDTRLDIESTTCAITTAHTCDIQKNSRDSQLAYGKGIEKCRKRFEKEKKEKKIEQQKLVKM